MGVQQHLKGLATNHPPLLVFTLCLMAFGVTMVVLAYIVREWDLPNPDIKLDWNLFLEHLSELQYCVPHQNITLMRLALNATSSGGMFQNTTSGEGTLRLGHSKSMSELLPDIGDQHEPQPVDEMPYNLSVSVYVPFDLHATPGMFPSLFTTSIPARLLGFRGKLGEKQLQITLGLPVDRNLTDCFNCPVCITVTGSSLLMPHTRRPLQCLNTFSEVTPVTVQDQNSLCPSSMGSLALSYTPDPKLTVMLSYHERSLVNLHLMHTSYFLFVMVMTLLGYSFIRSHRASMLRQATSNMMPEKVPLDM